MFQSFEAANDHYIRIFDFPKLRGCKRETIVSDKTLEVRYFENQ
ncbi:hypothetical protein M7I_0044 [Glarea lozoyensis 74030]|uniref:Uncharacterized protein n=1 Tax=Glarea lozoyensis (strain ATCC 74030 / MF5533) TaxID=1104152 RepID=H0ECB0_GLAL7|nr:hypothetical protein M7I_0044 [Glarea lozoyensis 74030]